MSAATSLAGLVLQVTSPERLAEFYVQHLGMRLSGKEDELRLGYDLTDAYLALRPSRSPAAYKHHPNDHYWKIGITLPNIDVAYAQLKVKGINVTEPRQFRDIGYLCHITDPEGFQVELLQHTFEGQPRTSDGDEKLPLGGGARIGQITLRTTDLETELDHYQTQMGMTLLSIQSVPDYDFDLYFLAFTNETPPHADLTSVQNREWLWQRPYTLLELQHRLKPGAIITPAAAKKTGYEGLRFKGD